MIYGDVTTVPRYGKSLAIALTVIITSSSDTWGKNIPPKKKRKRKKDKVNFFRVRKYSIKPPTPDSRSVRAFFRAIHTLCCHLSTNPGEQTVKTSPCCACARTQGWTAGSPQTLVPTSLLYCEKKSKRQFWTPPEQRWATLSWSGSWRAVYQGKVLLWDHFFCNKKRLATAR